MLTKRKFLIIWILGLMSGFSLMISGNTLNFWLSKESIDIRTIGVFALISIPYAINFIWAPIFDTIKLPILSNNFGQRISWIIIVQLLLSLFVYILSTMSPADNLLSFAFTGFCISFFASAQDTILGALRTEIVDKESQGAISGMYIFGYRIGMLLSSSGAIYISIYMKWNLVYELFSIIIFIFPIILISLSQELTTTPKSLLSINYKQYLQENTSYFQTIVSFIRAIIKPIGAPKYIILLILFLILYRLSDNFIGMMINPFLLHIGYDEFEIATAGKLFGVTSAIIGGLLASYIMRRRDLLDSMLIFGSLHAIAHLMFIVQDIYGKNLYLLFFVTGFESVTGGMTMAAYIAFIASLCHGTFRATQYSFLSSMMGLSRAILPSISGYIVTIAGWKLFYLFTSLATIPSLILILFLRRK
jgi:MFS transporter, PAT family, beta-lactamase induction signal transducer AmpG